MPWGLRRYQQEDDFHFITFSCYKRQPLLDSPSRRSLFEQSLESTRRLYQFLVFAYVVMPEHVHLLVNEPERKPLATALQALKQSVSRKLGTGDEPFWQTRYYDFNVFTDRKRVEKITYIHFNPVERGLVSSPEQWVWSSFRHWYSGFQGTVQIESEWTARQRQRDRGELPQDPSTS